ncbi:hypothetical protein ADK67_20510 [Saccharothrix sp. NRRL B-16348]|nr:hypothetical protein ADK67_20510 [Saccharothrix sp. NRRL B-16348]
MTAILLTAVGCSSDEPLATSEVRPTTTSSSAPPAPSDAQTAWAATVCGIDQALIEVSRAHNRISPGWRDAPGAHRAEIVALLTDVDSTLKSLQQQVATLTPAPFTGGDAIAQAYRRTIDPLQARMAEYAANAATFPPEGIAAAFRLALVELVSFTVDEPELEDPAYAHARRLAPPCGGR